MLIRVSSALYLCSLIVLIFFFFFNDTATTEIYTLSLHDALPISTLRMLAAMAASLVFTFAFGALAAKSRRAERVLIPLLDIDRKSTRLNSSHANISYAVFCLKKKNKKQAQIIIHTT